MKDRYVPKRGNETNAPTLTTSSKSPNSSVKLPQHHSLSTHRVPDSMVPNSSINNINNNIKVPQQQRQASSTNISINNHEPPNDIDKTKINPYTPNLKA
ncbi:hypothetical protein ACOMHN_034457 [Nucella lapillus]